MKDQLLQIKERLQQVNEKLSLTQKISIGAVLAVALAVIVAVVAGSTAVEDSFLFTNLSAEDSAMIVEELKKEKIPYTLQSGGSAITVPKDKVLDLRLKMASAGLPRGGGVGYEIFDKQDVTTLTRFTEHVNMVRALQGELSRTITNLSPIKAARVHIVLPKESMFVEDQKEPSASVMVTLYKGRALSQRHVSSILHLVSSSIEGMRPDKVSIVDSSGNVLSGADDELEGLSGKKLAYKRKVERRLEGNIMKLLNPVIGEGKSRVTVNTDMDFDRGVREEERYNPNVTAVRSETKTEESKISTKGQPGGLAGAQANLPGRAGQATNQAGGSQSNLEKSTTNFEINKTVRKVRENVGSVKKVAVSVVLDGKEIVENEETKIVPLGDEELKRIEELVKTAIGFDAARGDQVVVTSIPFAPVTAPAEVPVYEKLLPYLLRYLVPLVALLLIFLLVLRPLFKSIRALAPAPVTPEGAVLEAAELPGEERAKPEAIEKSEEEKEIDRLEAEIEESLGISIPREQLLVINYARKNIDVTTRILKKWMSEK